MTTKREIARTARNATRINIISQFYFFLFRFLVLVFRPHDKLPPSQSAMPRFLFFGVSPRYQIFQNAESNKKHQTSNRPPPSYMQTHTPPCFLGTPRQGRNAEAKGHEFVKLYRPVPIGVKRRHEMLQLQLIEVERSLAQLAKGSLEHLWGHRLLGFGFGFGFGGGFGGGGARGELLQSTAFCIGRTSRIL